MPLAGELAGITAAIRQELGGYLAPGAVPARLGLPEAARPALITALAQEQAGPTLVLAANPGRSVALAEELTLYTSDLPVLRLPEMEGLPYELARDDDAIRHERERALYALRGGARGIIVASWAALSLHTPPAGAEAEGIQLGVGNEIGPQRLVEQLEALGYDVESVADHHGSVARHGGIVDVYPPGAEQPYRIEFFGDEVESIRVVALETQRSLERVQEADFRPVSTGTRLAREAASRLLEHLTSDGDGAERVVEELAAIAEGARGEHEAFLDTVLYETSALDHIGQDVFVFAEDAASGAEALGTLLEHEDSARSEQERRGHIPSGLPPLRVDADAVRRLLDIHTQVSRVEPFGDEATGTTRLPFSVATAFAGRLKPLLQQAMAWERNGRPVVLATQQALRLSDLLEEEGGQAALARTLTEAPETGITMVPAAVSGGFVLADGLTVITDAEIFGFRKQRRSLRQRRSVRDDLVSSIEPGDYLVHADHGIARFGGMVRRTSNGVEREYLELQYAEGDRILVPADSLESVTRYVGPGDHKPALTRLDTQEWSRAKRKVRQSVLELAQDLVDLYAKREMAEGVAYPPDHPWQLELEAAFPFVETPDQAAAIGEVKRDMEQTRPMDRLLCGDVGYGKTEVAIRAAFKAVMSGKQVGVLVPTTVLAEQHGHTFRERTAGFPVRVEVLSRFRSDEEQRDIVRRVREGEVDIVVGTHRLLQSDVQFKDLGLVIVDEEQRFGVSHKERLKEMRAEVDVLTLSATPIPRTLQMSLVGIRDMSSVMTPPEERLPVRTYVTEWDDEIVREAIDRELQRGGQVYFVHNRVHNIELVLKRLQEVVPEARIAVGHGQMREEQLARVMEEFGAGEHDILVCTTIIESGLDIPNVNTIIINNANQMGLAQLYQLRGRVGRGAHQAYAYLLYDRNRSISETAQKRLEAIFEASELGAGFQIALRDLEIRGAGNILGTAQSGHIAAVGFELYSKLVAEAVEAIKGVFRPEQTPKEPALPPAPSIDLPVSAHIPASYLDDMNHRLALYQRVSTIESVDQVASLQDELADRYGPVPPTVENLLYVALIKSLARRALVESINTSEPFIHIHVRDGTTEGQRKAVERLKLPGVIPGPKQVRIDRVSAGDGWMQLLVRLLRAMAVRGEEASPATREETPA